MNWKYEAIDKLKDYDAKRRAVRSIPEEIRTLEDAMGAIRSATGDTAPVQGGGSSHDDRLLNNIAKRQELEENLERTRAWLEHVDGALDALGADERLILERFYIYPEKGNVERLCGELGCEQTSVYRRRDKALRHFTVCLYGCTES